MNYQKIYNQLIEKSQNRNISDSEYTETHHIIPRCMNGPDDKSNLIKLTPEEHVIAHLLLAKIYKDPKLIYAANWMTNRVKNNKEYGWIKREFSRIEKETKSGVSRSKESVDKQISTILQKYRDGYISPRSGTTITQEHKDIISVSNTGKIVKTKSKSSLEGYILRYGFENGTKKYETDSKKKDSSSLEHYITKYGKEMGSIKYEKYRSFLSDNRSGENNPFYNKTHSRESKDKISLSTTGKSKTRTQTHNNKIGKANKGKTHEKVTCPYCNKEGGKNIMTRWHFSKCKHKNDK